MLHVVFMVLLIGVLIATVVSFAVMGLLQIYRTRALSREAHGLGMQFSPDDPFDVPRRYADFALVQSGHSPRADNVTHGRMEGRHVRAFDFRYEVGHGPRRVSRHYKVAVVEAKRELPDVLMWNDQDAESVPFQVRNSDAHLAGWAYCGNGELAAALKDACGDLADEGTSLQTCGSTLMVFARAGRHGGGYAKRLGEAIRAIQAIDPLPDDRRQEGGGSDQATEKTEPPLDFG